MDCAPLRSPSPTRTPTASRADSTSGSSIISRSAPLNSHLSKKSPSRVRLRRCRTREAAVLGFQVGAAYEVWAAKEVGRLSSRTHPHRHRPRRRRPRLEAVRHRPPLDARTLGTDRRGVAPASGTCLHAGRWWMQGVRAPRRRSRRGPRQVRPRPTCSAWSARARGRSRTRKRSAWLLSDAAIHPQFLADYGREIPAPADCRDLAINMRSRTEMEALQEEENGLREDERRGPTAMPLPRAKVPCDKPGYEAVAALQTSMGARGLPQGAEARWISCKTAPLSPPRPRATQPDVIARATRLGAPSGA